MARGTPHSDETKAAVMAALLAGQSVSAVAREYHVARATIRQWREGAGLGSTPVVDQQKRLDFGRKIGIYLDRVLDTLSVQAEEFADRPWIKKQDASDLAVLHGVLLDKAIRLLEALDPGDGDAAAD